MPPSALRRKALLSGTMLAAAVGGYARRAYAACVNSGGSTYQCSGANGTTQTISGTDASISTLAGFSINTTSQNGLRITSHGDVSYTDLNASPISASQSAIYAQLLNGDVNGVTLTITTNGALTGGLFGIRASNHNGNFVSTGPLTIVTRGNVTGGSAYFGSGIYAINWFGTNLSVTTGAGTTFRASRGIYAVNYSPGATLTINAGSDIIAIDRGIFAKNWGGSDVTVTTGGSITLSGDSSFGSSGIVAQNSGSGALTITTNGNVTGASVYGKFVNAGGYGIYALNRGTTLSVTTARGTTVSAGGVGIFAHNYGSGALTVTANGNVSGGSGDGILARSAGRAITVTVGPAAAVSSTGAAAIETRGAAATVTVAGTLNGGTGGAVKFGQTGTFANRLDLVTGAVINGAVLGGPGTDTLGLSGPESGSFNVAQLSSFEAGAKTETGTWTLTGTNAGITAFSVGGGTLAVNGSLSNATFTVSGGTLAGTGTVGNTLISGGSFAPGSGTPGSSMTINGTLAFSAASAYAVNLNPATSSFANVSGMATLGGAAVTASFANGSYISKRYTILTAGGISGSLGTLTNQNLPANFHDSLSYDTTHAYLDLALNFQLPAPNALNGNQQAVGDALTGFFNSSGGIPAAFFSLNANGLSQASGETATGSQQITFDAMGQFMGLLTDPFMSRTGGAGPSPGAAGFAAEQQGASAYAASKNGDAYAMFTKAPPAPFVQRWSVWAAGFGGSQSTDGNAAVGSNNTTSNIAGTAVGADYLFSPNTLAGFALAGGGTNFSVAGGGSGRSDLFQAGAYVRHTNGAAYLSAALAYGWQAITTDRTVTVAGFDHLRAGFNANAWSGRLEGGYRFVAPVIGGIGITPYAAAQFVTFDLPAYAEQALTGASNFALNYAAKDITDTRSELGIRSDKSFALQDGILTLRGRFAWAHDFNPDRSIAATFQTLPGASFVVNGAAQASDSALVTASAEKKWLNGWSAAATFEGEFSSVTRSYAGKGVIRYQW